MELALAARDVLLAPRCAGCDEPGSWLCVSCRDQCEPVAHDGRLALRAAGATVDAIVPVPLHRSRPAARGYDQAALLARAVAERTGLGLHPVLQRIREGRPQVELDRAARCEHPRNLRRQGALAQRAALVAIVDDVAATGATLANAAAAARSAGARTVRAYVVAIEE
jgi:predicted amidophosphoribosyltransferase